jgi:hypothetical protein
MQTKPENRALRPNGRTLSGHETKPAARVRPDHAASHGRATQRAATARRASAQMQAQGGASMDYQMGFTSGPSN